MKHKWLAFYNETEILGDHPVHLPLSVAAAIDNESAHSDLGVKVEPSLARYCNECGEKGGGQTGVRIEWTWATVASGPCRWGKTATGPVGIPADWAVEGIVVRVYDGPFLGSPVGGCSGHRR